MRKRETKIIDLGEGKVRMLSKGASELLLATCSSYLSETGERLPLDVES